MEKYLASNERQWRRLRTIVQGVLGLVVALAGSPYDGLITRNS